MTNEEFMQRYNEPVDIELCHKTLGELFRVFRESRVESKLTMHIPPDVNDYDLLLSRALDELERLRETVNN